MKGLLIKEGYLIWKYCRVYLLIVLLFPLFFILDSDNLYFSLYSAMFAGMLPITLQSVDEKEGWCAYALTMPYSRAQLVSAKYLVGLLMIAVPVVTSAAAAVIGKLWVSPSTSWMEILTLLSLCGTMGLVGPSLPLPFLFKLGAEKGRMLYMVSLIVFFALFFVIADIGLPSISAGGFSPLLFLAAAAVLYGLSWLLSIKFYQKREL